MSSATTYHVWTIGCQMNMADSRALVDQLEARGLRHVDKPEKADIIVLNTCVVRQSAENRAIGRIRSLKPIKQARPDVVLAVMGCLVGDDQTALRKQFPFVDIFLVPSQPGPLLDLLEGYGCRSVSSASQRTSPVSAFLPISYGCDHFCTYCIVRLRRGPLISRPLPEIVSEAETLISRGAREITLLGQNVDAYGSDSAGGPDLAELLQTLHQLDRLYRLRFLTSHPSDMRPTIIQAVAELPKVCEHFELPIQSGSDTVLQRMGRNYTATQYMALVKSIRERIPAVSIGTDVIVGFCGETDQEHQSTRDLLEAVRFDVVHIAAYSVRAGTPAERLADNVPAEEKQRRREALEKLQTRLATEINAAWKGKTVEVLVEDMKKGRWRGRTRNNKLVFFEDSDETSPQLAGKLVNVHITWSGPWSMIGTPVAVV